MVWAREMSCEAIQLDTHIIFVIQTASNNSSCHRQPNYMINFPKQLNFPKSFSKKYK